MFAATQALLNKFKTELRKHFQMNDVTTGVYLGVQVTKQANGDITLSQGKYVKEILTRYDQTRGPIATLPCDAGRHPHIDKDGPEPSKTFHHLYQSKFGSCLWLPMWTRPDLAYAVALHRRFNSRPSQDNMDGLNHIMSFIRGTPNNGLTYKKGGDLTMRMYVNADYNNCPDTRRSTTGYVLMIGDNPVSWRSRQQQVTALSTCEAEYMAVGECGTEAL